MYLVTQPSIHYHLLFIIDLQEKQRLTLTTGPYTVAESDLELFFKDFCKDDKFLGLNVTLPYKKEVFHLCQKTTDKSKLISAVNTLFKQERFVVGESTDGFGLISDFKLKKYFFKR